MPGEQNNITSVIEILASYLTATDRAAADPTGAIVNLGTLVMQWLNSSPSASVLFHQFQQDPSNQNLQAAVHGRLAELLMSDPSMATRLESELKKLECVTESQPAPPQPQHFDMRFQGTMRNSAILQGPGTIDQSRKKTFKISFPIAGIALLASGALTGGGIAIYNATTGPSATDTAEYTYYAAPSQPLPSTSPNVSTNACSGANEFVLFDWTTQPNGSFVGTLRIIPPPEATQTHGPCLAPLSEQDFTLSGNQSGNDVQINIRYGNILHGTISGNTLQIQDPSFNVTVPKLQRTTPAQFDFIFGSYTGSASNPGDQQAFNSSSLDNGVLNILREDYKINTQSVECPAKEPIQAGTTFICTAMIDGEQKHVQITVKDDSGAYEVGQPQ